MKEVIPSTNDAEFYGYLEEPKVRNLALKLICSLVKLLNETTFNHDFNDYYYTWWRRASKHKMNYRKCKREEGKRSLSALYRIEQV